MAGLVGLVSFVAYMLLIVGITQGAQALGASKDVGEALLAIVLGGIALWARRDSARHRYHEYQSEIAMEPTWFAVAMLVASPLVLPWYLADRYRIRKGTLPKRVTVTSVPGRLGLDDRD